MSETPHRPVNLPEVNLSRPEDAWIHTRSVTGPHGITAEVRDFTEVLDWQEKRRALTRGYFRLIHPPQVQAFKARLEARLAGWTAVLYTSPGLACKEWLEWWAVDGASVCHIQVATPGAAWIEQVPDQHAGLTLSTGEDGGDLVLWDGLPGALPEPAVDVIFGLRDPVSGARAGVVLTRNAGRAEVLHERNRRRGGSLSARDVDALMGDLEPVPDTSGRIPAVETTLCQLESARDCFLYPSGMEAVTAALDVVITPEKPRVLVVGHVYRDTHLILEELPWGGRKVEAEFLGTHDLADLERLLREPGVGAVLLETVTNPLIEVPDLPAVVDLARSAGVPVLVDSTMATPVNCRPLSLGADVVIHSTSKYLSGSNQHGGGAVLTRDEAWGDRLRRDQVAWGLCMSPLEAVPLQQGLGTFEERMERFNRNGKALAERLRAHPAVRQVWYGDELERSWLNGFGSVVSCVLRDESEQALGRLFDHPMPGVHKAPSLGSDTTLFCPYVLLAYYDKSVDYLTDYGLPRHLLRFACGCESDFEPVLLGIEAALDAVKV